jgi:hypothetical protein
MHCKNQNTISPICWLKSQRFPYIDRGVHTNNIKANATIKGEFDACECGARRLVSISGIGRRRCAATRPSRCARRTPVDAQRGAPPRDPSALFIRRAHRRFISKCDFSLCASAAAAAATPVVRKCAVIFRRLECSSPRTHTSFIYLRFAPLKSVIFRPLCSRLLLLAPRSPPLASPCAALGALGRPGVQITRLLTLALTRVLV